MMPIIVIGAFYTLIKVWPPRVPMFTLLHSWGFYCGKSFFFVVRKLFPMFKQCLNIFTAENHQIGFFYYSKIACANINWQLDELKITILKNYTKICLWQKLLSKQIRKKSHFSIRNNRSSTTTCNREGIHVQNTPLEITKNKQKLFIMASLH